MYLYHFQMKLILKLSIIFFCFVFILKARAEDTEDNILAWLEEDNDSFIGFLENRIEFYQPNYFIFDGPQHEIQFSAKYRILKTTNPKFEEWTKLYFAYTQKSIWKPNGAGAGNNENFLYSNYNPVVFYAYDFDQRYAQKLELRLGFEHESDGLGKEFDTLHHEWDRLYIRSTQSFFDDQLRLQIKIWHAFLSARYNPDIIKYYGHGEINLATNYFKKYRLNKLEVTCRKGTNYNLKDLGCLMEQNFSLLEFKRLQLKVPLNFYIQYYYHYGDILENYKIGKDDVRVGVSLDFWH